MPVGTNGTMKAVSNNFIEELRVNLILSNAYHLYLRPGMEIIKNAGGLHRFMNWSHNILTDSGGFQIFSLAPFRKIKDEGVRFRSHIDGAYHFLTPSDVIEIQTTIGSDIMMPLDVCTPFGISEKEALKALEITTAWARESRKKWQEGEVNRFLFGIIQGNFFPHLRKQSAEQLIDLDLPGYAIGGLSVGEGFEVFSDMLSLTRQYIPYDKPLYVMGIGTPQFILKAVELGVDMFDCVFPTRIARNALAFTHSGNLNLRLEKNKFDNGPIDAACSCYTCQNYSRSYLRHLFKAKEINGAVLTTQHNLFFIEQLMNSIRKSIEEDKFNIFMTNFLNQYSSGVA